MRRLFAYFIYLYQSKVSPHKGFTCAHRGLHGGDSCSEYAKKQLIEHGVFTCLKATKKRFKECRDAAGTIQQRPPLSQRGDCDLGLSSCDVCSGGSEASSALDCVGGNCDVINSCDLSRRNTKRLLLLLLIIGLIIVASSYYFTGRQISSVEIRVKPGVEETKDNDALSKIFHSQMPDYKINFYLKNGSATTNTLKNTSAKNWISLETNGSFYLTDITKMVIVNKEITRSKELESISNPQKEGIGKVFEYSIKQKWELF